LMADRLAKVFCKRSYRRSQMQPFSGRAFTSVTVR
jgi:hypothetical protein